MADPSRATLIIPADSGAGLLQDLTGKDIDLNDYVTGNMQNQFGDFNIAPVNASVPIVLRTTQVPPTWLL